MSSPPSCSAHVSRHFQQFRTRLVDTLIVHIDGTEGTDNIDMADGQSQRIEQHAAPAALSSAPNCCGSRPCAVFA